MVTSLHSAQIHASTTVVYQSGCLDQCCSPAGCIPTIACNPGDCGSGLSTITSEHATRNASIQTYIGNEFSTLRNWLLNTFTRDLLINAMQRMANQLTAVFMQQTFTIGAMMDAQNQLETQRTLQELQIQAHQDYHPSESFCTFGTASRSIARADELSTITKLALNTRQMGRHLAIQNTPGDDKVDNDKAQRWRQFTARYCDPRDNNWNSTDNNSGLQSICTPTNNRPNFDADDLNIDIDFTRAIENRRVLNINGANWNNDGDEIDLIALGNNLYGHKTLTRNFSAQNLRSPILAGRYLNLRSIAAKRNVAENSFNSIVALKSEGSRINNTNEYLGRILQDLGIPQDEVVSYLGLNPNSDSDNANASYYATLEILAKKIYQNPSFFAQLYDTPVNVKRKSTALEAIELMLDRAIYESQLRREMALSVLLSSRTQQYMKNRSSIMWGKDK